MGASLRPTTGGHARVMHPNSLANLRPISPEHRANGRSHGASVLEWINRLDVPGMSLVKLRAIAADEEAPPSKRKAAQSHLRSLQMEHAKNGRPLAYDDLTLQLDYTHGKPTQRVEVTKREIADPRAMTLDLLHMLAEHPELRQVMANELAGLLPQAGDAAEGVGAPKEDAGAG